MVFPGTDLDIIIQAYLGADPTADPGSWPSPTDLSSRLLRKDIQIRRGRGQNQKTASAGSCTFWLDNTDGALTPLLATSPYYPDWDLGVPMDLSVDNVGASPPYVRHAGFVADVSAAMVPGVGGENISAVRVTLAGVLRRLTQGAVAKSALTRSTLAADPLAYWPMEGSGDSDTQIASALPGGNPIVGTDLTYTDGPPGSDGALNLIEAAARFGAEGVVNLPSTAEFQVEFAAASDSGALTVMLQISAYISGGGISTGLPAANADGEPHHRAIQFTQNGANVDVDFYVDGALSSSTTSVGETIAGQIKLYLAMGSFGTGTVTLSHLAVFELTSDPSTRVDAVTGHAGEPAHERIERLCNEEGIPFSGTATNSVACGPQPVADTVAILRDSEAVDHGMLIEDFAFGLNYRASSQRFNLDPSTTVDLSTYKTTSGTQGDVLAPIRNDARIRNEWTITRTGGSSKTAKDEAHQARKGRFNDSATVNVANDDSQLADEAQWRVHEGTFDGLRYDVVPLDLGANE